jgi:hypothetical protein
MIAKTVAVQNKLGDGIKDAGWKDVNGIHVLYDLILL